MHSGNTAAPTVPVPVQFLDHCIVSRPEGIFHLPVPKNVSRNDCQKVGQLFQFKLKLFF